MSMKLWVRARQAVHEFGISLFPMGESDDGRKTYVKDITYEEFDSVMLPQNQVGMTLSDAAAKRLMDDLWLAGVRPSDELYGSTDKEDIKNHLADMRRIVFEGITINLSSQPVDNESKT